MEMNDLLDKVSGLINEQASIHKAALEEQKKLGKANSDKLEKLDKLSEDCERFTTAYTDLQAVKQQAEEAKAKAEELETRINRKDKDAGESYKFTSLGEHFTEDKQFKSFMSSRAFESRGTSSGKISLPDPFTFGQKDIVTEGQGPSLIRSQRQPGILHIPNIPLTVRSILPVGRTSSNSVEYVKESTQTNNAGPQYSPGSSPAQYDGALKNKSDLTYTLATAPVRTIAHYMKASRQILDDVPQLQSEINNRLMYFLALEEELELLLGDGTSGQLLGIIPQSTAYDTDYDVDADTKIDTIRHALLQVTVSKYLPTNIVLHPEDWHDIELVKAEAGGANTGNYILSNPASQTAPRLWGYPVLSSLNMTNGDFLVGNFALGAQIFDRMESGVQIANQNEDDFIRNMITILAEERIALAVYRGDAFVEGTF